MRLRLLLAVLLVAGCATHEEPHPAYGYPAYGYPAYGSAPRAAPVTIHRPVHLAPPRIHRPPPPPPHRVVTPPPRPEEWRRRRDGDDRRWQHRSGPERGWGQGPPREEGEGRPRRMVRPGTDDDGRRRVRD